jgi:hypothetical protein
MCNTGSKGQSNLPFILRTDGRAEDSSRVYPEGLEEARWSGTGHGMLTLDVSA